MDIVGKAYESSYSVLGNTPLIAIDVNGADSTLFNENGSILCRISNDEGRTSAYFVLKTTQTTDQMYTFNYKDKNEKGWTKPISLKEEADAYKSLIEYNVTKALVGDNPNQLDRDLLKKYVKTIKWDAFVEIPNQRRGRVSLNHLKDMDREYPKGNREFAWDIGTKDREYEYEIGTESRDDRVYHVLAPTVGDEGDPNLSIIVSVDYRNNHSHPAGWVQPPSATDIRNSKRIRYVWSIGNKTLYIFNKEGVLAKIPFSVYK